MRAAAFGILAALTACARAEKPRPDVLAGTWTAEFHLGRHIPGLSGGPSASGTVRLHLHPSRVACDSTLVCGSLVMGDHDLRFRPMLGPSSADEPIAGGAVRPDGSVWIVMGGSGDRGAVLADGRVKEGEIRGTWMREYLGDVPGGWFVMRRRAGE
jgi:hypothetical protein